MSADGAGAADTAARVRRILREIADYHTYWRTTELPDAFDLERDLGIGAPERMEIALGLEIEFGLRIFERGEAFPATVGGLVAAVDAKRAAGTVLGGHDVVREVDFAHAPLTAGSVAERHRGRVGLFVAVEGRGDGAQPVMFWIDAPGLAFGDAFDVANNIARRLNRNSERLPPR